VAGRRDHVGVFHRGGADDDPLDAGLQRLFDGLQVTDAAAKLGGYEHRAYDFFDDRQVGDFSGLGAVEVNQVQAGSTQRLPAEGGIRRVFGENNFAVVVALVKPDTLAAPDVDCRDNFYGRSPFINACS